MAVEGLTFIKENLEDIYNCMRMLLTLYFFYDLIISIKIRFYRVLKC